MVKKMFTLAAAVVVFSGATFAAEAPKDGGPTSEKKAEVKLTEVRICPMMGHAVKGEGAGQRVYKNYKLYFC